MTAIQKTNPDFYMIDTSIDYLTESQFSILSWAACGKSKSEIAEILNLSPEVIEEEIDNTLVQMEVEDMQTATKLYALWIDDFEENFLGMIG